MSGSKQENTDRVEPTRETSRRGFLTGGTAALASVAAATALGEQAAAADPPGCKGNMSAKSFGVLCAANGDIEEIDHHDDDDALVNAVVRAWNDYNYYLDLTTGNPNEVKQALAAVGYDVLTGTVYKVLTQADFESAGHKRANANELLFVLPTPPVGGGLTGQTARDLMAAVPFGM